MHKVVAGVDTSTQSCKVEFRSVPDFKLVARGTAPHPPTSPPCSEQDPQSWWSAFTEAFRAALAAAPNVQVQAISVAGQCHGLVALDRKGQVIRPAKLWNDTTTDPELQELVHLIGEQRLIEHTGSLPTAAFTISKVAWMKVHEPDNFAQMATMLLPHDYLTYRLTGQFVTDRSEASGTGYFDAAQNHYVFDFLRIIDPDKPWEQMVPRVAGPDEIVGYITAEASAELGITDATVVGAGAGDQHASAVGLGIGRGDLCVALGTSGVVFTTTPAPVRDPSGLINGVAAMAGGFLPLACTLNAAKVTDTFARILGVDLDTLAKLALTADEEGPVLVAFLDGERTPNRPRAKGLMADITVDTSREQVARAAFEGVVFGLANGITHLNAAGVDTSGAVLAIGGGSRSPAYTQLLSDALNRPVFTTTATEAVARGAALQALAVTLLLPLAQVMQSHVPERQTAATPRATGQRRWNRYLQAAAIDALDQPKGTTT